MISSELPRSILSAAQCKAIDRRAIERLDIPGYLLMQRAAQAALALIRQRWPLCRSLSIWAGAGNNGGDGVVLARLAHEMGWNVQLVVAEPFSPEGGRPEAVEAWKDLPEEVEPEIFSCDLQVDADLLVDALLGIGLRGVVREPASEMIRAINQLSVPVLALDQPSGLDTDLGVVLGDCVRADATLTFIANKLGWLTGEGPAYAGERYWAGLGVPSELIDEVEPYASLTRDAELRRQLPKRSRTAHKGEFGVVTILGGNLGMGGSVILAAQAALRAGAGRVILLTRPEHRSAALACAPEVMVYGAEQPAEFTQLLEQSDVVVVGPGLGQDDWAVKMLELAEGYNGPRVFDADALNLLALGRARGSEKTIYTPHPGEAARMLGVSVQEVQQDRLAALLNLERRYGGVPILKGSGTLTAIEGQIEVCHLGNPGMATAGMGDLLSGIIAALVAQGLALTDAATSGVYIHARAGDLAASSGERGLRATDLLPFVRAVVNDNEIDN